MRKLHIITFLTILIACSTSFSQNYSTILKSGPDFHAGFVLGYNGGFGAQANITISNFKIRFPLSARIGIGYTTIDPGKPDAARKIFINNATNGTPEESGRIWDLRFDMLIPINLLSNSLIYFGPRYSMFTGNFRYIGGNEDFDVTTNQFGLGGGIEFQLPVAANIAMILNGGIEYFFESTLKGHDTSYGPDGDVVNQREDYSYGDADDAINQPKILGRFMIGLNFSF